MSSATHACTTVDCHGFYEVHLHPALAGSMSDRVTFKLGQTVHRCLSNKTPHYLADSCTLVSNIASRQRLRSAQRRHLDVPRHNRSTLGRRSFSVAGPTVWNSLPDELRYQGCNNSAESELIWMKSGKVWAKFGGWPWQILGAIRAVVTVWDGSFFKENAKIAHKISRSCDFRPS